jgi:glucose-1-phosphate cytidylyltransferase
VRVAILAGGFGTRLAEHTDNIPKPMVPVGGYPIIWHIMKIYAAQGHDDFAVALGYLGNVIKEYFVNYRYHDRSISVDTATGDVKTLNGAGENWRIDLVETGLHTQTKGRVDQICKHIGNEPFMLTYGDGVSDIDIAKLLEFHKSHGKIATITVVRPPARFGAVEVTGDAVTRFEEKPQIGEGWINGGFFVLEPEVAKYVAGADAMWEQDPLENLAADGELMAYRHEGFWQSMDSLRDVRYLESLWDSGNPPWKVWSH